MDSRGWGVRPHDEKRKHMFVCGDVLLPSSAALPAARVRVLKFVSLVTRLHTNRRLTRALRHTERRQQSNLPPAKDGWVNE